MERTEKKLALFSRRLPLALGGSRLLLEVVSTTMWMLYGIESIIGTLLVLKLFEMFLHLAALYRLPNEYADRTVALLGRWRRGNIDDAQLQLLAKERPRVWAPRVRWPVTKVLLERTAIAPGLSSVLLFVFRWPVLMAAQCVILLFAQHTAVLIVGSSVALCGVWVELDHRFLSRIKWGYVDTSHRLVDKRRLWQRGLDITEVIIPSRLQMVRDFVFLFAKLICAVILSYWSIFVALSRWASGPPFVGLDTGAAGAFELLYFSIVTLATVGYGDIYPKTGMARALVASEILAGFSLLVLLLTAFALSADTEEPLDQEL